jgi:hypothetical protein
MKKSFVRILGLIVLQVVLVVTVTTGLFASDPIFTMVSTSITGRVWLDFNGSNNLEQPVLPVTNASVFIQRIDQADFAMTLVVYTDEVGGYAVEGLPAGVYQIWTESDSDGVSLLVVTIDESAPTATANLPLVGHRVFLPTVMHER